MALFRVESAKGVLCVVSGCPHAGLLVCGSMFAQGSICLDRTGLSSHKHTHINICDSSCLLSSTVASFKTHLRFKMAAVTTITASMRQLTPATVFGICYSKLHQQYHTIT